MNIISVYSLRVIFFSYQTEYEGNSFTEINRRDLCIVEQETHDFSHLSLHELNLVWHGYSLNVY